ncbi:PIN domain-containing protein [Dyadobacter sp. CY327]|uniref:PIN domain-containing protein n=1 Tax=Dyadobacter sp. CY327 TaxID=2907301 RepID=UPI0038D4BB55
MDCHDTNTLISASLSPRSTNAAAIKRALYLGVLIYSYSTWSEFLKVLFHTKFNKYFIITEREEFADKFVTVFLHQTVAIVLDCRDPKDNIFLN